MSGFLLDTNVISMLAPSRSDAPAAFLRWLDHMDEEGLLFLSVVTVHEIERGIALLDHKGATARAAALRAWLSGLVATYDDKILGLDSATAALSGTLEARAMAAGHTPGMADALIAGIAQAHGLRIITSNIKHFLPFGVPVTTPGKAAIL